MELQVQPRDCGSTSTGRGWVLRNRGQRSSRSSSLWEQSQVRRQRQRPPGVGSALSEPRAGGGVRECAAGPTPRHLLACRLCCPTLLLPLQEHSTAPSHVSPQSVPIPTEGCQESGTGAVWGFQGGCPLHTDPWEQGSPCSPGNRPGGHCNLTLKENSEALLRELVL